MKSFSLYIIHILSFFLILSCSSIKVKNLTDNGGVVKKIKTVEIIAQNENVNHNGKKIADFVLKENPKPLGSMDVNWDKVKNEMKDLSISSGANLIEINTIGYGIKGHVFYIEGTLFYSDNFDSNNRKVEPCSIVIFRDGLESPLGSAFRINIKIDSVEFNKINKRKHIKTEFSNCTKSVSLVVNKNNYEIELNGESRYYKVSKQTSGNSLNGGVQIRIGEIYMTEILDKDLARLMMFQN